MHPGGNKYLDNVGVEREGHKFEHNCQKYGIASSEVSTFEMGRL